MLQRGSRDTAPSGATSSTLSPPYHLNKTRRTTMLLCARHHATALASHWSSGSSFSAHLPSIADSPHIRGNGQISPKNTKRSCETDAREGSAPGSAADARLARRSAQSGDQKGHGRPRLGHGSAAAAGQFMGPAPRFFRGA